MWLDQLIEVGKYNSSRRQQRSFPINTSQTSNSQESVSFVSIPVIYIPITHHHGNQVFLTDKRRLPRYRTSLGRAFFFSPPSAGNKNPDPKNLGKPSTTAFCPSWHRMKLVLKQQPDFYLEDCENPSVRPNSGNIRFSMKLVDVRGLGTMA